MWSKIFFDNIYVFLCLTTIILVSTYSDYSWYIFSEYYWFTNTQFIFESIYDFFESEKYKNV